MKRVPPPSIEASLTAPARPGHGSGSGSGSGSGHGNGSGHGSGSGSGYGNGHGSGSGSGSGHGHGSGNGHGHGNGSANALRPLNRDQREIAREIDGTSRCEQISGMPISFRERLEGMLLAGALGDCVGSTVEGVGASQLPSPVRWSWTDDTQLTVATCEAIVAAGAVSPEAVAAAMLGYYRRGILRGLGSTTLGALQALGAGAHWALSGLGGEYSAGNGAAMRVAPLGFFIDPTNYLERRVFRDVVRITHKNDAAYAAALAVVISVAEAIEPSGKGVVERLPDSRTRDAIERFQPSWTIAQAAGALGTSGYAAESVPLALYAVSCAGRDGFVPVLEQLVQVGGDVDTIASIYGQVYGAAHGSGSLPIELIADLPGKEELTLVAHQLSTLLGAG